MATTTEASRYQKAILGGLQGLRHIYAGTASPTKVSKRRAKNKLAKASRKANRPR